MARPMGDGNVSTSVSCSIHFFQLCKENDIKLSDAFRAGIALKLAEIGVRPYPDNWEIVKKCKNYKEKMTIFREKLEAQGKK